MKIMDAHIIPFRSIFVKSQVTHALSDMCNLDLVPFGRSLVVGRRSFVGPSLPRRRPASFSQSSRSGRSFGAPAEPLQPDPRAPHSFTPWPSPRSLRSSSLALASSSLPPSLLPCCTLQERTGSARRLLAAPALTGSPLKRAPAGSTPPKLSSLKTKNKLKVWQAQRTACLSALDLIDR